MNHILKIILMYIAMFVALALFWFWMAKPSSELISLEPNVKLQCLSYAPFGKDESPFDFDRGLKLSKERIDKDLELLAKYTSCIRTYSSTGLEDIPTLARKHGLKMWLGAWVSSDPVLTKKEIANMIALAKANADIIETVVVGNEALLRREVSAPQLVAYIEEVKKALPKITVTYADVWEFWNQHPEVAPAVDRVTIHILPYWEDKPIGVEHALLHVKNIRKLMMEKIPDKEIVIGETGWPSEGRMRERALPSPLSQAIFVRGFVQMAETEGWKYNFIEAFDQPWKRISEGAVGGYWGLFDANRADKHVLHGYVSDFPNALWLFAASFILSLVGGILLLKEESCSCKKSPYLFVTLFFGSIALVWQANLYLLTCRNYFEYGWAIISLIVAFALWVKLVSFIVTDETTKRGSMSGAIGVLLRQMTWSETSKEDFLHLFAVSITLMAAIGLTFDGRYHNFEIGTLGIIAVVYAGFFATDAHFNENSVIEKMSGLILFIASLLVLLHESGRNTYALNWSVMVFVLGITLWVSNERFCGFTKTLLVLIASGFAFWAIKENIYVKESLVEVCALSPNSFICQIRFWLGKIIYLNIAGWAGLGFALLGILGRSYFLALIAMVLGLFCLLTFSGTIGAIVFVLGWWVIGYKINHKI